MKNARGCASSLLMLLYSGLKKIKEGKEPFPSHTSRRKKSSYKSFHSWLLKGLQAAKLVAKCPCDKKFPSQRLMNWKQIIA